MTANDGQRAKQSRPANWTSSSLRQRYPNRLQPKPRRRERMARDLTSTRGNNSRRTQIHFVAYPVYPRFLLPCPLSPSPIIMSAGNHVCGPVLQIVNEKGQFQEAYLQNGTTLWSTPRPDALLGMRKNLQGFVRIPFCRITRKSCSERVCGRDDNADLGSKTQVGVRWQPCEVTSYSVRN